MAKSFTSSSSSPTWPTTGRPAQRAIALLGNLSHHADQIAVGHIRSLYLRDEIHCDRIGSHQQGAQPALAAALVAKTNARPSANRRLTPNCKTKP